MVPAYQKIEQTHKWEVRQICYHNLMLHYLLQLKLPEQEQSYQDNLRLGPPMAVDNLVTKQIMYNKGRSFITHNSSFHFRCLVLKLRLSDMLWLYWLLTQVGWRMAINHGRGRWVVKQMALVLVWDACIMKRPWQMHYSVKWDGNMSTNCKLERNFGYSCGFCQDTIPVPAWKDWHKPHKTCSNSCLHLSFKDEDGWFLWLYVSTKQHSVTSYKTVILTLQCTAF